MNSIKPHAIDIKNHDGWFRRICDEYICLARLESKLSDLAATYVNPYFCTKCKKQFNSEIPPKSEKNAPFCGALRFLVEPTGVEPVSENLLI